MERSQPCRQSRGRGVSPIIDRDHDRVDLEVVGSPRHDVSVPAGRRVRAATRGNPMAWRSLSEARFHGNRLATERAGTCVAIVAATDSTACPAERTEPERLTGQWNVGSQRRSRRFECAHLHCPCRPARLLRARRVSRRRRLASEAVDDLIDSSPTPPVSRPGFVRCPSGGEVDADTLATGPARDGRRGAGRVQRARSCGTVEARIAVDGRDASTRHDDDVTCGTGDPRRGGQVGAAAGGAARRA